MAAYFRAGCGRRSAARGETGRSWRRLDRGLPIVGLGLVDTEAGRELGVGAGALRLARGRRCRYADLGLAVQFGDAIAAFRRSARERPFLPRRARRSICARTLREHSRPTLR